MQDYHPVPVVRRLSRSVTPQQAPTQASTRSATHGRRSVQATCPTVPGDSRCSRSITRQPAKTLGVTLLRNSDIYRLDQRCLTQHRAYQSSMLGIT